MIDLFTYDRSIYLTGRWITSCYDVILGRGISDWRGAGTGGEHSAAGMACQQLQEFRSNAGDYHRQVAGRCSVCPRLRRNWRLPIFSLSLSLFLCCD